MSMLHAGDDSGECTGNEQFRALRQGELDECLNLWTRVFERTGRDYFVPYFEGDPRFKCEYTRVCLADDSIVSSVHICEREVRVGESLILVGGIANVATHPDFRRRGYGTRLMQDAVEVMGRDGMDCSILFTGIHPFYEKVGWCCVPVPSLSCALKTTLGEGSDSKYSTRTCEWPYDIPTIQLIHDEFNSRRPLTVVRDDDYWKGYALPRFGGPKSTLLAGTGGRVTGYLLYESEGENCWLREIGYLSDDEECVDVLVRTAASRSLDAGAKILHSRLPSEPAVLESLGRIADQMNHHDLKGMMCRIVNMKSLGKKILPELNRRARLNKSPSGSLRLRTELGSLDLTVRFGHVSMGAHAPQLVPLSQAEFFSLLFGIKSLYELRIDASSKSRGILNALFPPQCSVYWEPDGF